MSTQAQKTRQWIIYATALLVLMLATIAFIVWNDTQQMTGAVSRAATERLGVDRLRVVRPDHPDIVLSRTDDSWRMSNPCELAVNQSRLEPLLSLVNAAAHSYPAADVDLDAAGLLAPQATVFFNDEKITIGNTDLGGERRYLQRNDRVEFAPEWVLSLIDGGLTAFAELSLFAQTLESIDLTLQDKIKNPFGDNVIDWQSITANQIVVLPLPAEDTLIDTWSLTATTATNESTMTLYQYTSYGAFVPENSQCAFLVANDALPGEAN